jgi:uncharacterized protein (DUF433 family)
MNALLRQPAIMPRLGEGVYTMPDAARILGLPLPRVQRWITGYSRVLAQGCRTHSRGIVDGGCWGLGPQRGLNFLALIEVFTFAALRHLRVSSQRIRKARAELGERFNTAYPFASHQLLSDGPQILVVLGTIEEPVLMILGENGQTALRKVVEPFCRKIDFCRSTSLAESFWPLGREHAVVVDPRHGFGRPTIAGTNITTEVIAQFVKAGESLDLVGYEFEVPKNAVVDAVAFEQRESA